MHIEGEQGKNVIVVGATTNIPISKAGSTAQFYADAVAETVAALIKIGRPTRSDDGKVFCFIEAGKDRATYAMFNYTTPPQPRAPNKPTHAFKMAYNKLYWSPFAAFCEEAATSREQSTVESRRAAAESATGALIDAGDLDRLVALARVVGGAEDALSDEIVGRLAGIAAEGMDLVDKLNRCGVARGLPAVVALVENGDLDRIVALARVIGGTGDALSDEAIGRLAGVADEGIDLIDKVNISGVAQALPAVVALIENGDLDRIISLARAIGGMEDALSDEMIGRLAGIASESVSIFDRLHRDGFSTRLLMLASQMEASGVLLQLIG